MKTAVVNNAPDTVNKPETNILTTKKAPPKGEFFRKAKKQKGLIAVSMIFIIYIFIFNYVPIWGWLMAFEDYQPYIGIMHSPFVGLKQFAVLFSDSTFIDVIRNTLGMSILNLITGYIAAILLAIFLNEVKNIFFKRTIQTISYLPHFISWVVASNIVIMFLSTEDTGLFNKFLQAIGIIHQPVLWLGYEKYFWWIIAFSNVWKDVGWNAIIYLSAMTAIDPSLYEAASIDGAGRIKKIMHITIPGIMPIVKILLIMQCGWILNAGFEQQLLLGNSAVMNVSQVIDIFVMKYGIQQGRYSYATAAGIFKSVVSIALLLLANTFAKKFGDESVI